MTVQGMFLIISLTGFHQNKIYAYGDEVNEKNRQKFQYFQSFNA